MNPRSPIQIGPFPGSAEIEEQIRADAATALSCALAQAATILVAMLAIGLFGLLSWSQMARYDAALAACAGV